MQVQFEIADVTKRNYPAESFDVVYSRDTILHIKDKPALFAKFLVRKCISEKLVQVTLQFLPSCHSGIYCKCLNNLEVTDIA